MRYTEAPARRAELLRRVAEAGYLSSLDAAGELGVSDMTIRRDLRALAEQGLVRRVAGGASALVPPTGRPFEQRRTAAAAEKAAVADAAVDLLGDSGVVALDAGTAVAALAALLPGGLTVVTHSEPVLRTCTAREDLELIALGGTYSRATRSFTGPIARAGLSDLAVDVAVLSATAASASGVYCANAADAEMKRAMAAIAKRVILLLDHAKLGEHAPMRILDLAALDTVIVDGGASESEVAMLRAHCRQVVVAPVPAVEPPA